MKGAVVGVDNNLPPGAEGEARVFIETGGIRYTICVFEVHKEALAFAHGYVSSLSVMAEAQENSGQMTLQRISEIIALYRFAIAPANAKEGAN